MSDYKKIIVAIDFSKASNQIINKAIAIAQRNQAELHLVHCVDILIPFSNYDPSMFVFDIPIDNKEFIKSSNKHLLKLKDQYSKTVSTIKTLEGDAQSEILAYAQQQHADLIVLGSHGQGGITILLGSTVDSILHHAKCDVLAVRIKDIQ